MPDNQYHSTLEVLYSGIPRDLITKVKISFFPASRDNESVMVNAVWDTGATHSALSPIVARDLHLKTIDSTVVHGVNNSKESDIVIASIYLSDNISITGKRFTVNEIPGADVLIGMDIIMLGDFAISNGGGKTQLSFAIPPFVNKISFTEKATDINDRLSRKKK